MTEILNIIFSNIGKAFQTMASWELLPGLSLLNLFIILLVLEIVLHIVLNHIGTIQRISTESNARLYLESREHRRNDRSIRRSRDRYDRNNR